jgi:regulator of protease activity HflC (stomatin/prohibitin superfamily)
METPFILKHSKLLAGILLGTIVSASFWPIQSVPTGTRGVITVGGSIKGIESEGFTFVAPWQKLSIFNIRAEQADVDGSVGSTQDQQPVGTNLTIRYSIPQERVIEVFEKYSKDGDLSNYVKTATNECFKSVTAKFTAQELITKRSEVSNDVMETLRKKLNVYGANVISIDMRDFKFDDKYMDAVMAKNTQVQLKLSAENSVLTTEAEQQGKVVIAQAEADALKLKADGEAYATLKQAEALAKSLQIQNDALRQNKDVLQLKQIEVDMKKAEQWDGKLPTAIYAGAPIPFLNSEK